MPKTPAHQHPDADVRDGRLVVYMTPKDLDDLTRVSSALGLSRSGFVAAILERLLIGGFSARVGMQLGFQICQRLEERGESGNGFYFGIRPLPPLPEEHLSPAQQKKMLENVKQELKTC